MKTLLSSAVVVSIALTSALLSSTAGALMQDAAPAETPRQAPATTSTPPAGLPEASTILAKHIAALGGREKLDAITSSSYTAVSKTPNGDVTLTFASRKPDKLWMRQQIAGLGDMITACDGNEAWARTVREESYVLLEPAIKEQFRAGADLQALVRDLDRRFSTVKTIGVEKFGGVDAYAVSMREKEGPEVIGSFAIDSGLLLGWRMTDETATPSMTQIQSIGDWTTVDGVQVFRTVRTEINGLVVETTFSDIVFNKVDNATFEQPQRVKDLIAERDRRKKETSGSTSGTSNVK